MTGLNTLIKLYDVDAGAFTLTLGQFFAAEESVRAHEWCGIIDALDADGAYYPPGSSSSLWHIKLHHPAAAEAPAAPAAVPGFIAAQLTLTRSPRRARPVTLPRFDRDGSQNEVRA